MAGLPAIGCAAIDNAGAGPGRLGQLAIPWLLTVEDQAQSRIDAAKLVERQMAGALTKTVGIRPGARVSYRRLNQLGGGDHLA